MHVEESALAVVHVEELAVVHVEESAAVRAAVSDHVAKQEAQYERMQSMLDVLREGSASSPHMAAWMKDMVLALPQPGTAIAQPFSALSFGDVVCPSTGRIFRPWPLQHLLLHLQRFHVDLVGNPLLKAIMHAHGFNTPPCLVCGGPTEYLGDSMSIEHAKMNSKKDGGTKGGGIKMVLCPNGLFSPLTNGVSCCESKTCSRSRQPFDHVELLPHLPPSIAALIPIDRDGGVSAQTLIHRDVLRPAVMDMHLGEGPSNVAEEKLTKMGARLVTEAVNAALDLGQAWMNDLKLLAGDRVWGPMLEAEQCAASPHNPQSPTRCPALTLLPLTAHMLPTCCPQPSPPPS